jgi:hypothetical protein
MNAQSFGPLFGQYAAANDIVLIVPQAQHSWENLNTIGSDPTNDDQYTRKGKVMEFFRALITRATSAKDATFVDQLAAGEHTFGSAYPAGTWPDEGIEGVNAKSDKETW